MNYRHSFHAGNFADIVKHICLIELIKAMSQKDKPFCYIDTHAGCGYYDLNSKDAQKSHEAVFHTLEKNSDFSELITIVKNLNSSTSNLYPGSPYIAQQYLRPQDKIILSELHSETYQTLKNKFRLDKRITTLKQDGYQTLKSALPPKEKRGVVLIDPPFEISNEFEQIITNMATALKRFAGGVYMIWYPIKHDSQAKTFLNDLAKIVSKEFLSIIFGIYPMDNWQALNGCGVAIINPPYQLAQSLQPLIQKLWNCLKKSQNSMARVEFIQPN